MRPEFWFRVKKVFTGYPYLYRKHLVTNYGTRFTKPNPDVPANVPTCPFCGHALKLADEKLPLESLVEHVFEPNGTPTYKFVGVCSNDKCTMGKFFMYNYYSGEAYRRNDAYFEYFFKQGPDGRPDIHTYRSDELKALDKKMDEFIMCAGNTIECQAKFSIYKAGLVSAIYLHPLLCLGIRQPVIEINYKCDRQGNIKGKSYKLRFLAWDLDRFCIYKTTTINRFFSIIYYRLVFAKKFKQMLSEPSPSMDSLRDYYDEAFTLRYAPNDRTTRAALWCVKVLHPRLSRYTFNNEE